MTSNPRNPLPGEQPQDPRSGSGQPAQGQPASDQPASGQPGSGPPVSSRPAGAGQPARPASSRPAVSSQPASSRSAAGTQTMDRPPPAAPPRHRRPNTRRNAVLVILGLLAVVGIVTGFAVANNNTTTPAATRGPVIVRPHARPTAPVRTGHLLATFNGVGAKTSPSFLVTNPAFVHYGFKCASGTHSFSATMATTSGGNRQSIASTSGAGTSQATTVHPSSTGSSYRISANSACPYFIRVYSSR